MQDIDIAVQKATRNYVPDDAPKEKHVAGTCIYALYDTGECVSRVVGALCSLEDGCGRIWRARCCVITEQIAWGKRLGGTCSFCLTFL